MLAVIALFLVPSVPPFVSHVWLNVVYWGARPPSSG